MVVACIVAVASVACFLRLLASRSPKDIPMVVAAVAAWLVVNKPVEGPVLMGVTEDHGVTVADVLAVPPAVLCLLVVIGAFRRARRRRASKRGDGITDGQEREPADRSA